MDGATFIEVFPFWAFDRENYYTENSDTIYATLVYFIINKVPF